MSECGYDWMNRSYRTSLSWVLKHKRLVLGLTVLTLAVNVFLVYLRS
jgi:multidrug efflux pump subunit AcrB